MNFIVRILISTFAVLATCYLLPPTMVKIDGIQTAIVVAVVLAFLNAVVKPILIILTIPATLFTLGLFLLVINAFIIKIADHYIAGFNVYGWWSALVFSIVLTIVNSVFNALKKRDERRNS
jgi:putative membrane protein